MTDREEDRAQIDAVMTRIFNEVLHEALDRNIQGVAIVVLNKDSTAELKIFGRTDLLMAGALSYAQQYVLDLVKKNETRTCHSL